MNEQLLTGTLIIKPNQIYPNMSSHKIKSKIFMLESVKMLKYGLTRGPKDAQTPVGMSLYKLTFESLVLVCKKSNGRPF